MDVAASATIDKKKTKKQLQPSQGSGEKIVCLQSEKG